MSPGGGGRTCRGGDYDIRKCTAASYAVSVWKQVGLRNCVIGLDTCGRQRIAVRRRFLVPTGIRPIRLAGDSHTGVPTSFFFLLIYLLISFISAAVVGNI